ncbi:MAG: RHS repeat domain-containing protein, partial [Gelidibacter sp.]
IVKVENSTSSIVQSAVQLAVPTGFNSPEDMFVNIGTLTTAVQKATLKSFNDSIRNNVSLKDAYITTYTYFPTVGITSQTDPRGETIYYHYDAFNRLEYVKDAEGKILRKTEYNYKL